MTGHLRHSFIWSARRRSVDDQCGMGRSCRRDGPPAITLSGPAMDEQVLRMAREIGHDLGAGHGGKPDAQSPSGRHRKADAPLEGIWVSLAMMRLASFGGRAGESLVPVESFMLFQSENILSLHQLRPELQKPLPDVRAGFSVALESPVSPDLDLLFARHVEAMQADTPPESIHMLPRAELASPRIDFLVLRDPLRLPVGMGALKRISHDHGEIKSMHVLAERRGEGLAREMLKALIAQARLGGYARLSLETGAQPSFAAARALYARAGFGRCGPFEGYGPDPNSVFMTREV